MGMIIEWTCSNCGTEITKKENAQNRGLCHQCIMFEDDIKQTKKWECEKDK